MTGSFKDNMQQHNAFFCRANVQHPLKVHYHGASMRTI